MVDVRIQEDQILLTTIIRIEFFTRLFPITSLFVYNMLL